MRPADTAQAAKRRAFYAAIPGFAADLDGEPYALFSIDEFAPQTIAQIRSAAADAYHLFARTTTLVQSLDDETLGELGYPASTLPLVRMPQEPPSTIARIDLIYDGASFRAIEINADTPGFLLEAHAINGAVCAAFGVDDPNHGAEAMLQAALVRACSDARNPVFAALGAHVEDRNATEYLVRLARDAGVPARFVPLADLRIVRDALLDAHGRPIDVLYRNYPIELFADDCDGAGNQIGPALFDLIARGCVRIINPPSAFAMQNKAVYAVAWELYERGVFFTPDERATVERTFVPTWFDRPTDGAYVIKPIFGREGDTVTIVDDGEREDSPFKSYGGQPTIAQRYVPMPTRTIDMGTTRQAVSILHGCFVIDGVAGAIAVRAGGRITSNASYFQPVGIVP